MLVHSPPLPLIIDYLDDVREASAEDEESILPALRHRDCVRRIGLRMPAPNLLEPIKAMDGQFPALERLFIWPRTQDDTSLILPTTFQASHLGMISMSYATLPVGSPLLTTTVGLAFLSLWDMPLSAYFQLSYLVARLASMPQLESLSIGFQCPIPTHDTERQPLHTSIGMHVTLPNFRLLFFRGISAYLEGLLARISTPLLEVLQIRLFNQLNFTVPHLLQFMSRTENLGFRLARLTFYREVVVLTADRREEDRVNPLDVAIGCKHVDWQVSSAAQILNALVPVLSVVEGLVLGYEEHDLSSEQHNEVNHTQWCDLLRPFSGVKVLHVAGGLIRKLSHSLRLGDGQPPLELLPQLQELIYYKENDPGDAFTSFIDARQNAGRSVALIRNPPPPSSWL